MTENCIIADLVKVAANMVYDRKLASKQEKCMQSLLSGHISRLVEKNIAVSLTEFCKFFLQLTLNERVTESDFRQYDHRV